MIFLKLFFVKKFNFEKKIKMNFSQEILVKKNKLQEMVIEMKKMVDSLIDDVNKELSDKQTLTPVNRNLFKKINSNYFYYKDIDFDGEDII